MGYSYNNGLHTSSKALTSEAIRVTGLNVAPGASALCTIAEDCRSGLVASVTHTATGVYRFQLSKPYPPKMVVIDPNLSAAGPTSALLTARYQNGSYNATTGQFIVNISNATPAAAAGGAADELHVQMQFNRYNGK